MTLGEFLRRLAADHGVTVKRAPLVFEMEGFATFEVRDPKGHVPVWIFLERIVVPIRFTARLPVLAEEDELAPTVIEATLLALKIEDFGEPGRRGGE
jgi:hypothetical protein